MRYSANTCEDKKKAMGLDIWSANYQQEPIDLKGGSIVILKLILGDLPTFKQVSYIDTADEGDDYYAPVSMELLSK